jgi:hypothetical protein
MATSGSNSRKAHKRASFGQLGRLADRRLSNDNDIKIIIQGANSQTGVGKTTLAIQLCRYIDRQEWSAEDKAFIRPQKYLNSYLDYPEGSALLLDEIGAGADSRRATSTENVELSKGWQMLRSRNIATVATLPSTSMLDKRMLELADVWILVRQRGVAQPYKINVNDFNGAISRDAFAGEEHIRFPDLPDGDEDKRYLDHIKDDKVRDGGMQTIKKAKHEKKLKDAREKAAKERRDEIVTALHQETDMSYADIGGLSVIDLTKQTVGQIVRSTDLTSD